MGYVRVAHRCIHSTFIMYQEMSTLHAFWWHTVGTRVTVITWVASGDFIQFLYNSSAGKGHSALWEAPAVTRAMAARRVNKKLHTLLWFPCGLHIWLCFSGRKKILCPDRSPVSVVTALPQEPKFHWQNYRANPESILQVQCTCVSHSTTWAISLFLVYISKLCDLARL